MYLLEGMILALSPESITSELAIENVEERIEATEVDGLEFQYCTETIIRVPGWT